MDNYYINLNNFINGEKYIFNNREMENLCIKDQMNVIPINKNLISNKINNIDNFEFKKYNKNKNIVSNLYSNGKNCIYFSMSLSFYLYLYKDFLNKIKNIVDDEKDIKIIDNYKNNENNINNSMNFYNLICNLYKNNKLSINDFFNLNELNLNNCNNLLNIYLNEYECDCKLTINLYIDDIVNININYKLFQFLLKNKLITNINGIYPLQDFIIKNIFIYNLED